MAYGRFTVDGHIRTLVLGEVTVIQLLRNRIFVVWAILMAATVLSWWVGSATVLNHRLSSVLVVLVAFAKVSAIGTYFMELRHAPAALQLLFQSWCFLGTAAIVWMYLML